MPGPAASLEAARPLLEGALDALWRGRIEDDDFNALVLDAAADLAPGRDPARLRPVPAAGGHLVQPGLHRPGAAVQRDRDPAAGHAVRVPVRPGPEARAVRAERGHRRGDQRRARRGGEPGPGPDPAGGLGADPRHAADQLLPGRSRSPARACPTSRSSWTRPRCPTCPRPGRGSRCSSTRPAFEGVHLRVGPIARGGLRWCERPEDFRTEVLGLAKAQEVKNAVIVPTGAKGGFVVQAAARLREPRRGRRRGVWPATRCSSRPCWTSPTTWSPGRWCRRRGCARHDGDDPYLVVAADKGTATFSDTANAIAHELRVLARRRVRVRRLGRLRPQEDGHHRARRVGVGEVATSSTLGPATRSAGLHRGRASATCPATCSATACCGPSTSG